MRCGAFDFSPPAFREATIFATLFAARREDAADASSPYAARFTPAPLIAAAMDDASRRHATLRCCLCDEMITRFSAATAFSPRRGFFFFDAFDIALFSRYAFLLLRHYAAFFAPCYFLRA